MNILVVVHYHYQGIGVPTALFVHEQMKAFVKLGHRVRVLVPTPVGKVGQDGKRFGPAIYRETVDGIEHVFLRHPSFSNYGKKWLNGWCARTVMERHLREILEDFQPDVIHAHKLGTNTYLAAALRERVGCPLVFTCHGETVCEEPWMSDPQLIRQYAEQADRVVCVSTPLRTSMQEHGVSAPMQVILNGFHLHHSNISAERESYSIAQAGYLIPRKKVDVTLRAFTQFREKHPAATMTVIGKGSEREKLEALSRELGVEAAVRFTGEVPNAEVMAEMAKARFFCMPSVHEGFGIVYSEAMASGCITIGTEGEGIADVIESGKNGFLVPPDDPDAIAAVMEWCLAHPEEAAAIAAQGRQDALSLTWERNAEQYLRLFEELCS